MSRFNQRAVFAPLFATVVALSAGSARADTVVLKDGKRLDGSVKVQELGKYVVIILASGAQKTVMWDDLKEVEITPPGASGTAPAAVGPLQQKDETRADTSMVETTAPHIPSERVECSPHEPACRVERTVHVERQLAARPLAATGCSTGGGQSCSPPAPAPAPVGPDAGPTAPPVAAAVVARPLSGGAQVGVMGNFLVYPSAAATSIGATLGLDYRLFSGGAFPDEKGGPLSGVFFDPCAQLTLIEVADTWSAGALLDTTAGLQWLAFNPADPVSHDQGGLGLAVGAEAGMVVPFGEGESSFTYGGVLSLLLPAYTHATNSWRTDQFNFFVLSAAGGIVLLIGGQSNFG